MSAHTAMARSRSLRLHAKGAMTAPQPNSSANATVVPSCTSNVALFITNLRLLDLDHESDWPGITAATFSARDAAGGQKKRIQCVEWALYQLFLLWDYDEAQNKLRPFYPPLDQVQSINLRAALTRSLEQAKKSGVLGRDVVIRKTMLDECKGERLEEALAVFSSAVLKKLVAERALNSGPAHRPTISESLALQNWGYSGDRAELNTLLLVHKTSLTSHLARKNAARERYREFEELLARKEREIARRREQARVAAQSPMVETSEVAKAEVRKIMKTNWTGNEQWIDGILLNETESRKGGLLGTPWNTVWADIQHGRVADLEDRNSGLLEQLDNRVRLQKSRLEEWSQFRTKMFGAALPRQAEEVQAKATPKGVDFGFHAHLEVNFDMAERQKSASLTAPPPEYATILQGLKTDLGKLSEPKLPDFSSLLSTATKPGPRLEPVQLLAQPEPPADPVSDLSEWEDEPDEAKQPPPSPSARRSPSPRRRIPRQASLLGGLRSSQIRGSVTKQPGEAPDKPGEAPMSSSSVQRQSQQYPKISQPASDGSTDPFKRSTSPVHAAPLEADRSRPTSSSLQSSSEVADTAMPPAAAIIAAAAARPSSPTQLLADDILASMANTSPSPVKKTRYTLSLAERARMSMARTAVSYDAEDDDDEISSSARVSPVKSSSGGGGAAGNGVVEPPSQRGDEYEDLVARTRRSMLGFEAARQKAQLERRRSQRKSNNNSNNNNNRAPGGQQQRKDSYFPRVNEEEAEDVSVADELLMMEGDGDAQGGGDYEAVFKSRPRLVMSPTPGPEED
ncbi:HAUS augmin-like complex subunit 6 N-terminus-domain-containing protein [Xylariaceae sp. FL0804]|nr:HAUS augmin-like complex subunit 6 N-terminus-domain-containing protein [Xylariaceae sp. FL0804]